MKTKKTYSVFIMLAALVLCTAQWGEALTDVSADTAYAALQADATAVIIDVRTVDEHNGCDRPWASASTGCPDTSGSNAYVGTPMWTAGGVSKLPINVPWWNVAVARGTSAPEDEAEVRAIIGKLLAAGVIDYSTPIYLLCRTAYRSHYMGVWMEGTTFASGTGAADGLSVFTNLFDIDTDGAPGGGSGGMEEWNRSGDGSGLPVYNSGGVETDYYVPPQVFSITPAGGDAVTTSLVPFTISILEPITATWATSAGSFSYPAVTRVSLNIAGSEADFDTTGTTGLWTDYPLSDTLTNNTYTWNSSAVSSAGTSWSPHALASGLDDRSLTVSAFPEIDVAPLSVGFGQVQTGTSSSAQTVTIDNLGGADLSVSNIQLTGTDTSDFSLDLSTCGGTSPTVTAGSSCTVTVTFSPFSAGAKSATLEVDSDDSNEAQVDVTLTGTGSATAVPDIDVTPTSVAFGIVAMETTSSASTVTIANTGGEKLLVSDIQLTGTDASDFSLDLSTCGGISPEILVGDSCTVTITFSPSSVGAKSSILEIYSDDPDTNEAQVDVSLTGTGQVLPVPPVVGADVPELASPDDASTVSDSLTLRWKPFTNADKYELYLCKDPGFAGTETGCSGAAEKIEVAALENNGAYYYAGTGLGLLLFGIVLTGGVRERRKIMLLLAAMAITSGMLFVSCGDDSESKFNPSSGNTPENAESNAYKEYAVSGLDSGSTYYWGVTAVDVDGNSIATSAKWSFTVE